MEEDIFNEMASEDGSGELGHQVIIRSCNDRDSSNSPFFSASNSGLREKHVDKIDNEFYRLKYEKIKKLTKGFVFENASLCDEVSHLQEKILIAKEERRFLLRKLLGFQGQREGSVQQNPNASTATSQPSKAAILESVDFQNKKKSSIKKRPPSQKLIEESVNKAKNKKKKICGDKRLVQPIPLDGCGRPIFPIVLGALTIHSLGVIVPDRPGFHNEHFIFPAGFCSSRTYLSIKDPTHHCLYTCTIVDASFGPRFEIIPEDDPEHPIMGSTVNECHTNLLKAVNSRCGKEIVKPEGHGARFFGLSHPTVQNLIQSCAGARKCMDYRWNHFELPNQEKTSS